MDAKTIGLIVVCVLCLIISIVCVIIAATTKGEKGADSTVVGPRGPQGIQGEPGSLKIDHFEENLQGAKAILTENKLVFVKDEQALYVTAKNAEGQWVPQLLTRNFPYVKGDKGDQGPKGEQGGPGKDGDQFPPGTILAIKKEVAKNWNGVPYAGWEFCDGQEGRPDLNGGKFMRGIGPSDEIVDGFTGKEKYKLQKGDLPDHEHKLVDYSENLKNAGVLGGSEADLKACKNAENCNMNTGKYYSGLKQDTAGWNYVLRSRGIHGYPATQTEIPLTPANVPVVFIIKVN